MIDLSGRFIILETETNNKRIILVNVYAPNKDAQTVRFFRRLNSVMKEYNVMEEENVIIGGDFNCPLNPLMDKKGGIMVPRQSVIFKMPLKKFKQTLIYMIFGELKIQQLVAIL